VWANKLVFVSVVVLALFLVTVYVLLSSSVAEESGEDDNEDQDTDGDTDNDVQGAVVTGGGGDGVDAAALVNGQSFAWAIINFSGSGVADALLGIIEVKHTGTVTTVSWALIIWVDSKDGFQSAFKTAVTFGGTSSSSTAGACKWAAGTDTNVDRHINFKGKGARLSVHGEAHLPVTKGCIDSDSKAGGFSRRASVLEEGEGTTASWCSGEDSDVLYIDSSSVSYVQLKTSKLTSLYIWSGDEEILLVKVGYILCDGNIDSSGRSRSENIIDVNQIVSHDTGGVVSSSEADSDVLSFLLGAHVGEVNERCGDVLQSGGVGKHIDRGVDGVVVLPCGGIAIGENVGRVVGVEFSGASGCVGGHEVDVPVITTDTVEPIGV